MNGADDVDVLQSAILSEVFHDLSQPLTALECNLELSLRCDQTVRIALRLCDDTPNFIVLNGDMENAIVEALR